MTLRNARYSTRWHHETLKETENALAPKSTELILTAQPKALAQKSNAIVDVFEMCSVVKCM